MLVGFLNVISTCVTHLGADLQESHDERIWPVIRRSL